jgi:hypothetical protein
LDAALQSLTNPGVPEPRLTALRRQAEMAISTADAGLQRLRVEPAHPQALFASGFAMLMYLQRLCRHAIALAAQAQIANVPAEPVERLRGVLAAVMTEVQAVIREERAAAPWPSVGTQITAWVERSGADAPAPVATLLRYLERDVMGLLTAAGFPTAYSEA